MFENALFWKVFSRRSLISFFIIMLMFLSCILRVAVIASSDYESVRVSQNSYKLKISDLRGTVFDRNLVPLTNNVKRTIAAVSPTPRAVTGISSILEGEKLQDVLNRLKSGKPVLCETDKKIECDGIVFTDVYSNSDSSLAAHLIGYTDTDSKGVSGIEAAYDSLLYSEKQAYVSYETSAAGDMLKGLEPTVFNDSSIRAGGVVTTLDVNLQSLAEEAADNIESGAVVIADAKSCEILATASRPNFSPLNVSEYLNQKNSPLLNRAINAYNVGSVFKPCVAIAGMENKKGSFIYRCTGSCEIIDRFFKCHKSSGHGYMNLCSGLAQSCNTFFYNFSFHIGADAVYNTAKTLKFGSSLQICDGISTAKGNLPQKESLSNIAYLANFSIGQGELLLSPISMLTLYCSIASDGAYYIPSVVKGTLKDGSFTEYDKGNRTRVMSEKTAQKLREYLATVLTEGTGSNAKPKTVSAAGKTATAQTGRYENKTEICQSWFCGFFPAENPEYTVIVFSENSSHQKLSCAQIFASIADNISLLQVS